MKNINLIFPINISFNIIILVSIFNSINSLKFFPIENAKEDKSLNNSYLIFTIKGAVDSPINNNVSFSIEIKLFKDNELISEKNNVNCSISKNTKAEFGTKIISKCELDLFYTPLANKILFSKIISDSNLLTIEDQNNKILGKNLTFYKYINITPDYEYIVEDLKSVKCLKNEYIFGMIGEIDKIFVSSFIFNFTIHPSSFIKAECESPYIYFTKKTMINCTIKLLNDEIFLENLNKGIILKENYFRVNNDEGEKILKIKLGNNKEIIELKELICKEENKYNNTNNEEEDKEIKDKINEETKNKSINEEEEKISYKKNNEINEGKNDEINNISSIYNNSLDNKDFNIIKNNSYEDNIQNNSLINNYIKHNKEISNITKENKKAINDT